MNDNKIYKEELTIQEFKVRVEELLTILELNLFLLFNGLLNEDKEEFKPDEIPTSTDMAFIPFLKHSYAYAEEIEQKLKVLYNFITYTDKTMTENASEELLLSELDLNLKNLNDIVYSIFNKIDAIAKYFGLTYEIEKLTDCENENQFRWFLDSILYYLQNANGTLSLINDYVKI